jgi:hypothetical protein
MLNTTLVVNNNGINRTVSGTDRFYPLLFRNNSSIAYVDWFASSSVDKIGETAGTLYSSSGYKEKQSGVLKKGAKQIAFMSITLS